ncbi:e3 ubiquitin-protein ligase RNF31 [Caerostris extrusa]|uniref:E3 ubiquitin-protein ligase RNF31 n=1 Tax=Caerostris extrusa TaxID=172846 RepID=A0AAV4XGK5_CAEEX|nr:e3 ubiquitin-protein ligase RNF31 [Caerostris extrusa]
MTKDSNLDDTGSTSKIKKNESSSKLSDEKSNKDPISSNSILTNEIHSNSELNKLNSVTQSKEEEEYEQATPLNAKESKNENAKEKSKKSLITEKSNTDSLKQSIQKEDTLNDRNSKVTIQEESLQSEKISNTKLIPQEKESGKPESFKKQYGTQMVQSESKHHDNKIISTKEKSKTEPENSLPKPIGKEKDTKSSNKESNIQSEIKEPIPSTSKTNSSLTAVKQPTSDKTENQISLPNSNSNVNEVLSEISKDINSENETVYIEKTNVTNSSDNACSAVDKLNSSAGKADHAKMAINKDKHVSSTNKEQTTPIIDNMKLKTISSQPEEKRPSNDVSSSAASSQPEAKLLSNNATNDVSALNSNNIVAKDTNEPKSSLSTEKKSPTKVTKKKVKVLNITNSSGESVSSNVSAPTSVDSNTSATSSGTGISHDIDETVSSPAVETNKTDTIESPATLEKVSPLSETNESLTDSKSQSSPEKIDTSVTDTDTPSPPISNETAEIRETESNSASSTQNIKHTSESNSASTSESGSTMTSETISKQHSNLTSQKSEDIISNISNSSSSSIDEGNHIDDSKKKETANRKSSPVLEKESSSSEDEEEESESSEDDQSNSLEPPSPVEALRNRFEGLMDGNRNATIGPIRPQSPYRRMSFRSTKAAIALERTRDTSVEKPWFSSKPVNEQKKPPPKRSIKQQLEIDRKVRKLVADRKVRTYRKAEVVVQLMDMNFDEEEALQAANECSTLEQAISFLQQECLLCTGHYSVSGMVSMIHCPHKACRECIRAYFTVQIRDRNIMELLCPFCNEPDIFDDDIAQDYFNHLDIMLKKLVDPEIHELFQRKLRDRVLMRDPSFRWCSQWEREHQGISCEAFAALKGATDPEAQAAGLAKLLTEDGIDCPMCHFRYALAKGGCMHFRCTQCQHDFCSGCSRPFKMGQKCGVSDFCGKLGLHAHHPRNCLFYLRDKEPQDLQRLLDLSGVKYDRDPPEGMDVKRTCQVMEQKETTDGMVDDCCGKEVEEGFAGLCRIHYVEYLGQLVNKNKVDPIQIFEIDDLELVLRRANIRLPYKRYRETDAQHREKLVALIEEELPLDKMDGS